MSMLIHSISVLPTSVLFLSLAIFIFAYIEKLRQSVHGKIMMTTLTSLLISYIAFPFTVHEWIDELAWVFGHYLSFGVFLLGSWAVVLSYDSWRSFR
jgi:hypothetical protein